MPGAWHGAWCWSSLQCELDRAGVPSYAIDLPGRGTSAVEPSGLAGDVVAIDGALAAIGRPSLLVGHSYGGAPVSAAAGRSPLVAGVVYVAAFALRAGESVNGFLRSGPRRHVGLADVMRPRPDGSIDIDRDAAAGIYHDVPIAEAAAHVARLAVQPAGTFTDEVGADPFGRVATTYVLCEHDDAVHPDHQRILAERCDRTVALACGHFPMLTRAGELAAVIAAAAER